LVLLSYSLKWLRVEMSLSFKVTGEEELGLRRLIEASMATVMARMPVLDSLES
jgi:hypothetical protein